MRKLVTRMVAASPADMPTRRRSASNSDLARSVSYLTSRLISLTASETRSPTDRSSTFAGLAAPGSAIALSSLLRPGCWAAPAISVRHALRGAFAVKFRPRPARPAGAVRSDNMPPTAEILRDDQRPAGQHAMHCCLTRVAVSAQANGAPVGAPSLGTSGPGYQAHIHCAGWPATVGTGGRRQYTVGDYGGSPPAAGRAWVPGCRARTLSP